MRGVEPDKYRIGLGQALMAVPPPDEDVVTMGASAALPIMELIDRESIELLLFATESGIDQSKAAGMFVHQLLGLPKHCRVLEVKQACYSATAALRLACTYLATRPEKRALVIASDIARYDLKSPGEPTQGCGAVAMLVAANPRVMTLDDEAGLYAEDVMDFWRPNYRAEALVDGKYSTRVYLQAVQETWAHYVQQSGRSVDDFARFCYHLPFGRMAFKAHERLLKTADVQHAQVEEWQHLIVDGLAYNRVTGNSYSASLYESLTSLLDETADDLGGQRLGLFSYGSGCMGEFFSGQVVDGYRAHLLTDTHQAMLASRTELSYQAYEDIFNLEVPSDGWTYIFAQYQTGPFRFGGIDGHKRIYEAVT
ncbi:MAG: hydroxymethylglutaryl-CoA synthase, partial [Verrucomicrobia bacterium]|nr:hydroxymethylglutaryl-CoA synthase [Verrucomicrobiota bacterium]